MCRAVCSWVWFLVLAVLTGCLSFFFDVAPNVPNAGAGLAGILISVLSFWSIVSSKAGRRRGLSHFANCAVFFCVALISAFAYAVLLASERRKQQTWPSATGVIKTVQRHEVREYQVRGASPHVDSKYGYTFRVDGREYAGEYSERILLSTPLAKGWERNVGDAVMVFYDPQNPTDSCVRVLSLRGQSFWAGFLLVLAVVVLVFEMVRRRQNRVMYGWR